MKHPSHPCLHFPTDVSAGRDLPGTGSRDPAFDGRAFAHTRDHLEGAADRVELSPVPALADDLDEEVRTAQRVSVQDVVLLARREVLGGEVRADEPIVAAEGEQTVGVGGRSASITSTAVPQKASSGIVQVVTTTAATRRAVIARSPTP
jgi:hypothetical protein